MQRVDRQRAHGIDLFGHDHGADLRRVGRSRAAGNDDGADQRREFAQHRVAHQVDDEDVGAVVLELVRTLVGHHHAEQERGDADDGQGLPAAKLNIAQHRAPAQPPRMGEHATGGERGFADEAQ